MAIVEGTSTRPVLGIFLASSLSAIVANENLPGPEIIRFLVVWVLSFTPFALVVGYGIATPDNLQALLVYRKRMIQHEAGQFPHGALARILNPRVFYQCSQALMVET
jgi:hypothetical protein